MLCKTFKSHQHRCFGSQRVGTTSCLVNTFDKNQLHHRVCPCQVTGTGLFELVRELWHRPPPSYSLACLPTLQNAVTRLVFLWVRSDPGRSVTLCSAQKEAVSRFPPPRSVVTRCRVGTRPAAHKNNYFLSGPIRFFFVRQKTSVRAS